MYMGKQIGAVVPAYKEESQISDVVTSMPDYMDHIIVVEDASPPPDKTKK